MQLPVPENVGGGLKQMGTGRSPSQKCSKQWNAAQVHWLRGCAHSPWLMGESLQFLLALFPLHSVWQGHRPVLHCVTMWLVAPVCLGTIDFIPSI